jgi:catalase
MQTVPRFIQTRQIGHFYKADPDYGIEVAKGLGVGMEEIAGWTA